MSGSEAVRAIEGERDAAGRPTALLPLGQLLAISGYALGISALWGGYEVFGQQQVEQLVGTGMRGTVMGPLELGGAIVAILVQPTIGAISDHAATRWGRRKPFILLGALFDLVFLVGIVSSSTVLALGAFLALLQLSSNTAQGPFQGYVPDLVPEPQVARASALLGMMRILGLIGGYALVSTGAATGEYGIPLLAIGVFEVTLALLTVRFVREGPPGDGRRGRSWLAIARGAWGADILHERSFLRMAGVRLLFLAGPSAFVNYSLFYVRDSLGQSGTDQAFWLIAGNGALAVATALATIPAAGLSDRIGRKAVIRIAGAAIIAGILIITAAPSPLVAVGGILLLGAGSGAYVAVDWALMTEIIPLAASGRYMGLANIASSIAGPVATLVAGIVLDSVTASMGLSAGPRAAALTGIAFVVGGLLLLGGVRPARGPEAARAARAEAAAGGG